MISNLSTFFESFLKFLMVFEEHLSWKIKRKVSFFMKENECNCNTVKERVKNAIMSRGLMFCEWTMSYKGKSYDMFTTQTARKTLSEQPFLYSISAEEEKNILSICQSIFPENIYIGTEKEQKNYAKLYFTNTDDRSANDIYCEASDLYGDICNLNREVFSNLGTANAAMSLCTYAENKRSKGKIYSINAMAVAVDYKSAGFNGRSGKERVRDILKTEHFGKTMPYPTYVIEEDQIILVFVFKSPVYIYRHMDGINFFEWMSKIFAQRISYLGGMPMKANSLVQLPCSAIAKSREKKVRCETKWYACGNEKVDESNLRSFLMPMEEVKEKYPWYKTKKERKAKRKTCAWDPHFTQNTKNMMEDLIKIRDYYNTNNIYWHNNKILFIYCVYAFNIFHDEKVVYEMAESFSKGFCMEITNRKIKSTISCVLNKQYRFKNETVLKNLGIDEETASNLSLKTCVARNNRKRYISEWKKKKTDVRIKQKKSREEKVSNTIKELRESGLKNIAILKSLAKKGFEMSIKTLERYIGKMIKEGVIKPRINPT